MFRMMIAASAFSVLALPASAVTFEHVCTSLADCNNDADFSLTITLADSVVSANGSYNTTDDGGAAFLGWTGSSSVGDGFAISGGLADITHVSSGLTFLFDGSSILSGIIENGFGTNFFFAGSEGRIFFEENDTFLARTDLSPVAIADITPINANWQVATAAVPLPAGFPMLLTCLAGFAGLRMQKKRKAQV